MHLPARLGWDRHVRSARYWQEIQADITRRKKAENALAESERRFATVLSNAHAYVYCCRNEPGYPNEFASDYALELTGYAPEDLLVDGPVRFGDLILEEDRERVWEEVQGALERRECFKLRYAIRRKDGEIRHVEEYGQGIYDEEGEVVALEGLVYDVTEREQMEERLREAEQRYRTLVERISAVFYIQDATGSHPVTYMSPQIEAMLGYKPEEYTTDPEHWKRILHPADRKRVLEEDELTYETGEPFKMEYRQFARDGRVVWIRDEAVLVRDEGKPLYWQGVFMDITERKRAEEALRQSELRLRTIVTNVPVVLFALNRAGVFTLWEGKGLGVLGFEPGEVVGGSISEVYGHRPEILEDIDRAMDGAEFSAIRELDSRIFETWYSPLVAGTGEITGVIGVATDITERKEAEEALRRSEASLAEAQRMAHLGNWEWYLRTGEFYWSEEVFRIYGFSPGRIRPTFEKLMEVVHPDDRQLLKEKIDSALYSGEPYNFEHRVVRPDGEERVVHRRAEVIRDEEGEPLRMVGTIQDFTERKRVEEVRARLARQAELRADVSSALAESGNLRSVLQGCVEALVRHLDAAFARIWTLNEEEDVLELQASAGMYTHLDGAHSRVPVGSFKIGLIARECLPHLTNDVLGDPCVSDREWAKREGMVAFAGYPLVVEDRLVGVVAMFAREELTEETIDALRSVADAIAQGIERKRIEEALRRSEASLAEAQRMARLGNWEWDLRTGEIWWSDETFRICGFEPGVFTPSIERLLDVVHPEDRGLLRENVDSVLYRSEPYDIEHRIVLPSGEVRVVHRNAEIVRGERGEPLKLVGTVHDVTKRKKVEQEIREANRRLEELAVLKADFTAMVAHELDTPLAVIRGYADMLATGELEPADRDRALARIQAETDVLNALIADVRAAATVERDDFAIEPKPVPVGSLLEEAAALVKTLPGDHPLTVGIAADGQVWADPYRIGQVLRKLLSNATKYSLDGAPVELRTLPGVSPGRVRIEVADQGVGIHADDATRIFEKFGRGRDRSGRKVTGVGLGLYLSRRILRAHGSDLTLDADPGGGSVFGFELEAA
jgi:PAS domain S-box-containing protein